MAENKKQTPETTEEKKGLMTKLKENEKLAKAGSTAMKIIKPALYLAAGAAIFLAGEKFGGGGSDYKDVVDADYSETGTDSGDAEI